MTCHTYMSETMNNKLVINWKLTAKYGDIDATKYHLFKVILLFSRTILRGYKYS